MGKLDRSIVLVASVNGDAVSLLVSRVVVDILSTFCDEFVIFMV